MKYHFGDVWEGENGQIREGFTVLTIVNGEAEVTTDEEKALAEKYGGVPVKHDKDLTTKPLPDLDEDKPVKRGNK